MSDTISEAAKLRMLEAALEEADPEGGDPDWSYRPFAKALVKALAKRGLKIVQADQ